MKKIDIKHMKTK